jgi:MoaA/NifB/PqqE/SkfB family radical SAM enzyme
LRPQQRGGSEPRSIIDHLKGGYTLLFLGKRELLYIRGHLSGVAHTTLDPRGPGVVRIHLIPPGKRITGRTSYIVLLNGRDILPLSISWAILLSAFIEAINRFDGQEMPEEEWENVILQTVASAGAVYPRVKAEVLRRDTLKIISALLAVARGDQPKEDIGILSLSRYARHMRAPFRMDLMVCATDHNGQWACNQKCQHCYAAGQPLSGTAELPAEEWEAIIAKLRDIGIPQLTFTGGEPTLRKDLCRLIAAAKWFVTRLNTNGSLLTRQLCRDLHDAELDSVQITLYSQDSKIHNALVGADHWERTADGIRNAIAAGLNVSINTPLCVPNADYLSTLAFARSLGVRYVSCSGLIPAGNAKNSESAGTRLDSQALEGILRRAFDYCAANQMELSFTSPGCVDAAVLREIGITGIPSCGAALGNMAIAPNGDVIPCQSWLSEPPLGNIARDSWRSIWESRRCKALRARSAKMEGDCPLRGTQGGSVK